jgi:hypothetical protein
MIELKLECKKTQLRLKNAPEPLTEGLRNYTKIVFELGEDWTGKSITATFKRVIDQIPTSVTVSNGECVIPWEAFVYPVTEVSIRGTQGEEVITSSILRLEIKRSLNEGGAPLPPTEDLYDQILETAEAAETKADTVLQAYQSGELKGEKGDKGDSGQPGAKGDPGEQGEPGQAATVAVHSVVTGEPGTSAAVENMGTSSAASFKFTIPQGAKGDKGDKGDPGDGGVPEGGNPGQVLTKTESGVAWQDSEASGDYLPLTGGTVTGNVAVSTGTAEPNVTLNRTVDNAPCELTARIDSEAKAGLRYKVGTDTVNELILEQTKTRLRKPLDVASGGVPTTGTTGQVLTKTADGNAWQDLPDAVAPTAAELREILNTPVLEEVSGKAVLKTPDASATAILDIVGGGTGANNAADAANNLKVKSIGECTLIPNNSDLNELVTIGNYSVPLANSARTIMNTPHGESVSTQGGAFILTLYSSLGGTNQNYITQEYEQLSVTDVYKWIRRTFNKGETWSDWIKVASETDLANYLSLRGGTLTGTVTINQGSGSSIRLKIIRSDASSNVFTFSLSGENGLLALRDSENNILNSIVLAAGETSLKVPLALDSGGTGANSDKAAQHNLLSNMNSATDAPTDSSKLVFAYDASTANNGAIFKRPLSSLWSWIKGKADSIYAAKSHTHTVDNVGIKRGTKTFNVSGEFASFDESVSLDFNPTNYMILCVVLPTNGAADPSLMPSVQGGGAYKKTSNSFSVAGYCTISGSHKIEWVAIPLS